MISNFSFPGGNNEEKKKQILGDGVHYPELYQFYWMCDSFSEDGSALPDHPGADIPTSTIAYPVCSIILSKIAG